MRRHLHIEIQLVEAEKYEAARHAVRYLERGKKTGMEAGAGARPGVNI